MGGARGGRPPPLSLDQTKARKAEKKFFGDPSPPPPPLFIWRSGSSTANAETGKQNFTTFIK